MKLSKLCLFILFTILISGVGIASDWLGTATHSPGRVNPGLAHPLPFWAEVSTVQATGEMRPALWWTVFAVLLVDIGCVIGYLRYQRQMKWRRTYWRRAALDNQRRKAMVAALQATEMITVQRYELQEQPNEGGFYLALRPKKAPAPCGPALFS